MERVPFTHNRILASPNKLKLAVFGFSGSGGTTVTAAPGPPKGDDWDEQLRIVRLADEANIEAVLPGARWAGYGGPTNFQGKTYETLPWAAAMAAVTKQCSVFATYHVPTAHPVRLAKTIATIDHVARGRFGLNIVAGWNSAEMAMFGHEQREHDDRYEYADSFFEVCNALMDRDGYFDIHNAFFDLERLYSEPKPIQAPRPVYMSAGVSPRGRRFSAQNCDINFVVMQDPASAAAMVADTKRMARDEFGREIRVFGGVQIVCADTEAEAQRYFEYYVDEMGDYEAAANVLSSLFPQVQDATGGARELPPQMRGFARHFIAGHGAVPLIGTPETIVEQMAGFADAGLDGLTVQWVNYEEGLVQFREHLLPLLIDAGLREDEGTADDVAAAAAAVA